MNAIHTLRFAAAWSAAAVGSLWVVAAQAPQRPRVIYASPTPIVDVLRPGERQVFMKIQMFNESSGYGDKPMPAALVELNPVILTGRITQREPVFLDMFTGGYRYRIVPVSDANWVGSRLTVQVERVIRTRDTFPLKPGDRFNFVVEFDGSATINGTRVETETPDMWPIEQGKRYLIAGDYRATRSAPMEFVPSGLWLEASEGAALRGPGRKEVAPGSNVYDTVPTFERDGPDAPLALDAVANRLNQEVEKIRRKRP
jgi:hypothetical protein